MNNMPTNQNSYQENIQNNIIRLAAQNNISYRELSASIDASSCYIQKIIEGKFDPTLFKLDDKNLAITLTMVRELYGKQRE